jgi:BirA family biotin operon repressor/biotin-[acetyl-CoA-carboxylase] ligase
VSAVSPSEPAPIDPLALSQALTGPGRLWNQVQVVGETGSTIADLIAAAQEGSTAGRPGTVLVAQEQTAGRGRLDRRWVSPPGSGIAVSVLLAPRLPAARWSWLPLLVGLAAAEGVECVAGVGVQLKWPNDLLVGAGKLGGVLAERVQLPAWPGVGVVVGLGLNVDLPREALPVPQANSLLIAGAPQRDRTRLLVALLTRVEDRFRAWTAANGDAEATGLAADYRARCATLGSRVHVALPAGQLEGEAVGVASDGALLVCGADGQVRPLTAGDVVHVRGPGQDE